MGIMNYEGGYAKPPYHTDSEFSIFNSKLTKKHLPFFVEK